MKTKLVARHGDVFIFKVEDGKINKKNFNKSKAITLAYGEVTGHSHKLAVENSDILVNESFNENGIEGIAFELTEVGTLTHQEHEPIILQPGTYISVIQEEYDPILETRKVLD